MKPQIFVLKDFLIFGVLSILSIAAAITVFIALQPLQEAHALMTLVALLFTGLYVKFLLSRKSELSEFEYIKTNNFGMMISFGNYKGAEKEDITQEVNKIVEGWANHFGKDKTNNSLRKVDIIWVWFKEMPVSPPGNKNIEVAGYTVYHTSRMTVGYNEKYQELSKTAFAHELGHIIQANVTGKWDQKEHHERSKEANLP